ncbi:hypothetical protein [Kochikohdavirus PBEF19]|uniref:Uncharacterized protein n=1 Tax=Enterococcus phage PBEF129 TaxID=2696337 RepID=A0A7T3MK64_9CAUD|nr:hypothetical protein [Enterococcus phage PBEF129]
MLSWFFLTCQPFFLCKGGKFSSPYSTDFKKPSRYSFAYARCSLSPRNKYSKKLWVVIGSTLSGAITFAVSSIPDSIPFSSLKADNCPSKPRFTILTFKSISL